jgi:ribose transport system substrate-binding protein
MRKTYSCLTAFCLIAAVFSLTACAVSPHEPSEKYVLVTTNTKVPYWQNAFAGLSRATAEMKVKGEMAGPDTYDPKAEHTEFQRIVAQKPAGILVSAADAAIMTPDIDAALNAGIPVITIDSDAPQSKRLLFVGTDNYHAGTLGGKLVAKLLNGKGNLVVFTMPEQPNLKDRLHGYEDALAETPGIKISQVVDIKGEPTVAFDTTESLLNGKNKIDGFVCLEAIACPEVGDMVNRKHLGGQVVIVAMDTDPRTIDWIQKGVISATIAQKPYTMAYFGTKLIADIHLHPPSPLANTWTESPVAPLPTFVDTGTFIIDKTNVDSYLQQTKSTAGSH